MYIIYNRKNGKTLKKQFENIKEAIKEAEKQNIICKQYNFLVIKR